jgi:hypothetical protein
VPVAANVVHSVQVRIGNWTSEERKSRKLPAGKSALMEFDLRDAATREPGGLRPEVGP